MNPGDRILLTIPREPSREGEYIETRGARCRVLLDGETETRVVLRERVKPVPAPIQRTQVSTREALDRLVADGGKPVAYSQARSDRLTAKMLEEHRDIERLALKAIPKPPKPLRDAAYLRHVRAQPCCVGRDAATTTPCSGPVVAHHHGPRGMGEKTDDYRTVPLCDGHHREFHDRGTIGEWPRADLDRSFTRVMSDVLMPWLWATDRFAAREHIMDALIAHIRETAA